MDDRMRRENSANNEKRSVSDNASGKISVDIDSNSASEKVNPANLKNKKFEVHIPSSEGFSSGAPENAPTPRPPQNRPVGGVQTPVRRPQGIRPPTGVPSQGVRQAGSAVQRPVRPPASGATQSVRRPAPTSVQRPMSPPNAQQRPVSPAGGADNAVRQAAKPAEKPAKTKKSSRKKKREKQPKKNLGYTFLKGFLITCVCLLFVSTIVATVSTVAFSFINDVLVVDKENKSHSVTVEIPEGSNYYDIFEILKSKGLVSQPILTDFFCRFRDYDCSSYINEETGLEEIEYVEYAPGVYHIDADSGIEAILDSMLVYNNTNKDTVTLTFPEGWTIAEVFEKIEKYDVCTADKLYANLDATSQQYSFITEIADVEGRYLKAEGYLFPDTYDFFIGENASSVIDKLFSNFQSKWLPEYDEQLKKIGMTKDQVIILASVIQAEAKDGTQMADISSVIHNRLNNSASYPTIDMNSTMDYITDLKSYNVLSDVYYNLYIESYNTYNKTGLPPGAICNPGETAILAALYPSDTAYYFFCHDADGNVYYASTASEHQANVEQYVYTAAEEE